MKRVYLGLALTALLTACPGRNNIADQPEASVTDGATEAAVPDGAVADAGGSDATPTHIADLPVMSTTQLAGLDGAVDVVFDSHDWPHVYATTARDAAYVQGVLVARDRMAQMELLRRLASGTLTESFGALSSTLIERDLAMRVVGLRRAAQATWDQRATVLSARAQAVLTAYTAGVNSYITAVRNGDTTVTSGLEVVLNPGLQDWSEVDSLVIARYQSYSLSYDADSDISRTATRDAARRVFSATDPSPARVKRVGAWWDLYRYAPPSPEATVPGFLTTAHPQRYAPRTRSPQLTPALAQGLQHTLDLMQQGAQYLGDDSRGSNNWAVPGSATASHNAMLANDPHLSLTAPSVWWGVHLTVTGGADAVDVEGTSFPGIPWVVIGFNQHLAWGVTTAGYDVTDAYQETVTPGTGGAPDTVLFNGAQVPIESFVEHVPNGSGGFYDAHFERVPHHGIIVPTIANGQLAPRTGTSAVTIRWTGDLPTTEYLTFLDLSYAQNLDAARAAIREFGVGAQNFLVADNMGTILYQSSSIIPRRTPGALTWTPDSNLYGTNPCFVLPGDGTAEWSGNVPLEQIPQGAPTADHPFLASANQDQAGVTFDNNPVNDPYYLGCDFADGMRMRRISQRLRQLTPGSVRIEDLQSIQNDHTLLYGERLRPFLQQAFVALEAEWTTPGTHPDLSSLATALMPRQALLRDAAARIAAWTLDAASGVESGATPVQQTDATATLLFQGWLVKLLDASTGDEMAEIGYARSAWAGYRLQSLVFLLENPMQTHTYDDATGDSALWDDMGTPSVVESRNAVIVKALDDAMTQLATTTHSADVASWRWGAQHTLTAASVIPGPGASLSFPRPGDTMFPTGYPRPGGVESVDAAYPSITSFDFTYSSGPSQRFTVELTPTGPRAYNVLPGGQVFDPRSRFYVDQMTLWRQNQNFALPNTEAEVVAAADRRLRFTP